MIGLSSHLLSTSANGLKRFATRFVKNEASSSITAGLVCECDRIIYSLCRVGNNDSSKYIIQSFNILTSKTKTIGVLTHSDLLSPKNIGCIQSDGEFLYLTCKGSNYFYAINLNDLSVKRYSVTSNLTCHALTYWYDKENIVGLNQTGLCLFNTKTRTPSYQSFKPSGTRNGFAIGKELIVTVDTNLTYFDKTTSEYITIDFPTSTYSSMVCYDGEGKFFVANKAYLFIFDEASRSWHSENIPIGFGGDIRFMTYSGDILYIIVIGSNKLWAYDPSTNMFHYTILPWTLSSDSNLITTMAQFKRNVFLQWYTFGIINYEGMYKYNVGYKIGQYSVICTKEHEGDFINKGKHIEFKDSYLTIEDGIDLIPATPEQDQPTLKRCHINKKDYKFIKDINFSNKEESIDG